MGFIYIASPYSYSDPKIRHQRFEAVNKAAADLMKQGHIIFSPISHNHMIAKDHDLPTGWEFWERIDIEFVVKCSKLFVLMLPGWQESRGVKTEISVAKSLDIPVEYIEYPIKDTE